MLNRSLLFLEVIQFPPKVIIFQIITRKFQTHKLGTIISYHHHYRGKKTTSKYNYPNSILQTFFTLFTCEKQKNFWFFSFRLNILVTWLSFDIKSKKKKNGKRKTIAEMREYTKKMNKEKWRLFFFFPFKYFIEKCQISHIPFPRLCYCM